MPSFPLKPQQFLAPLAATFALALYLVFTARAGDEDQQAYCKYVTQQAAAQRDLLRTPDAIGGFTQPNTGLPHASRLGLTGRASPTFAKVRSRWTPLAKIANSTPQPPPPSKPSSTPSQISKNRLSKIDSP